MARGPCCVGSGERLWDLTHEGPDAPGQDEDPLAEDAVITQAPFEFGSAAGQRASAAASDAGREVVVPVRD